MALNINPNTGKGSTNLGALPPVVPVAPTPELINPADNTPRAGQIGALAQIVAAAQRGTAASNQFAIPTFGSPGVSQAALPSPIAPQQPGIPSGVPSSLAGLFGPGAAQPASGLAEYGLEPAPEFQGMAAPGVETGAMAMEPEAPMPGQPAPQGVAPITGATTISDLVARGLGVNQAPQAPQAPAMAQPGMPAPRVPQLPPMPQLPPPAGPQMLPQYAGADSRANFAPGGTPQLLPEAQARVDLANAPTFANWANQLQQMGIAGNPAAATFGVPSSGLAAPQPAPQAFPYGNPQAPQSGVQAPAGPQAPGGLQSPAAPYQGATQAPQLPVAPAPAAGPAPAPAVDPVVADLQRQVAELKAAVAKSAPAAPAAPAAQADPGRPYDPSSVPEQDVPAPIEQPQEQPQEVPQESPELEPAFTGSPLTQAKETTPIISNGQLTIGGGNLKNARPVSRSMMQRVGVSQAVLAQFVEHAQVGTLAWYKPTVDNEGEAAALAYEFARNQAQESMLVILLDKNNKPLSVLRHSLGGMSSTSFAGNIMAGVAAGTPGCRSVYMVHNHPSGTTKFSAADMTAAVTLSRLMEGVGVKFNGSIVVADAEAKPETSGRGEGAYGPRYIFHPGGKDVVSFLNSDNLETASKPITLAADTPGGEYMPGMAVKGASNGIPLTERVFQIRGQALAPKISNGVDAVQNIVPLLGGNPGIAFMDKGNRIMAVLPLTLQEMTNLVTTRNKRGTLGIQQANDQRGPRTTSETIDVGSTASDNSPLARILTVMDRSNTEQIIISIGDTEPDNQEAANAVNNIEFVAQKYKIAVLDTITNKRNIRPGEMKQHNLGGVNQTPKLPTGERLGFNEGNEEYDPSPLENEESQASQDYPEVMANRKATQRADGGEDGGAGIEGIVRNGLQGQYDDNLDEGNRPPPGGSGDFNMYSGDNKGVVVTLPDGTKQKMRKYSQPMTHAIAKRDASGWSVINVAPNEERANKLLAAAQKIVDEDKNRAPDPSGQGEGTKYLEVRLINLEGVSETNPEDPNAGAEFARQEREAGERVNGPLRSSLEGSQPAEPIIKKTRKPRAKPAAPNPSVFPTKLDSTLPFGRLTGDQMAQFGLSDAMLDQFVEHSTIGHVMSGVEFVKSADDAAHVVAGLRKRPQEQIILLVTDKNGRPIQIAGHQIGGPTSTGFNPGILIGTAASTPGAAKVWFIHNHPSGKASLSPADISSGNNIERLLKAAKLDYMGTMAIAGTRYAQMTPNGRIESNMAIKASPRKFKVPVTERTFSFRVSQDRISVSDPQTAMAEAERIFGKDQPGLILLDNSNRMVATIPLAADVLQAMKAKIPGTDQTGFNRFVSGIDRSNPVNLMIYTASLDDGVARKVIQNMSGVAQSTKLTVLDAFGAGGVSRQTDIRSYGSDFEESGTEYTPDGGQDNEPQTLRDVVDQAAKKKNDLEVGEGEPDAEGMVKMGELERSWREHLAAKKEAAARAAVAPGGVRANHDNQALADNGFITYRASQDMAKIMERINKRFPDGYPVDGWKADGTYGREKKKIVNLRLSYTSDGDPLGNFEAQDYVIINAVFEDGTTRQVASLDLMRGYASTPESPTLVTKVGMSDVNTDLQKLGLGSIMYVEGGERLRRMGQRYLTGSVINPAAVATRVKAFPKGSTELLAVPGSANMSQKQMAQEALLLIKSGVAAYTKTTLDPNVALEPGAEANQDDQLTEPGAGYDDGENMRIPGGARDKFLDDKEQLVKTFKEYGYMTLGHGIDTFGEPVDKTGAWKKKAYMFIIDPDGMVRVSDTIDKEEAKYIRTMEKEWVGMAVTLKDMLKAQPNTNVVIHRQAFPGLRSMAVQGRVEIRDGVAYVSVIKNNNQNENTAKERQQRLDQIRSTVREKTGVRDVRIVDMSAPADVDPTREADSAREPAMPYDDGENTRIPGSERDERLKKIEKQVRAMERLGYMHIGHGYGADPANPGAWKKKTKLWTLSKDDRIVFSKTVDKLEKIYIDKLKLELDKAETGLKSGDDRAYYEYRVKWLKSKIDKLEGESKSSSSPITHMRETSGFSATEHPGGNPQGRVEITDEGVFVSIANFRGRLESVADERMLMQEVRDAVAKDLGVPPGQVHVADMDGGTDVTDTLTPDDGSAREPGMAYDDGENQAIPGGGRQAWLKQQAELRAKNELPGAKRIQWWTDVGHKIGKKNREKTWLWAYDKQGKLQVFNAQELKDKLEADQDTVVSQPTHLDWEEMYAPGLLAGAAHGRIDATGDIIRVSLAGRISDPTFREQVKQELAEYIGADVDKVKGYDFTGDGMPELFNRTEADQAGDMDQIVSDLEGMDVDEAKAYFKNNPDKALLVSMKGLPPHLEKILQAMRDVGYNETKAYLEAHPIGRMLLANGRIVLVRDASEIPGLSPLEAASGGFNALVLGNDREATYFVGGAISEAEIDALIKHEVGVHMGIGKDTDLVNDLYAELWSLIENGDFGDMDKIMAKDAVTDAFAVVASHYGMRSDPNNKKQRGDRILDKMNAGMAATKVRYTDARIISILKDEGLDQEQIDNFMRMFHEETLGYLMNIMARRDARVNAPKDSLFAIIIQWIKATMIRMAYANSSGGSRPLVGLTMGAIRTSSKVARFAGLNQLSKLLEIRPGDVRAIAQGYAKAYAAGKEIGMPETRAGTNESDMQHEARDAQEARVRGRANDPVTSAATFFSKRDNRAPNSTLSGTEEFAANSRANPQPDQPASATQVEDGHMKWNEVPGGTSEFGDMGEISGTVPLNEALNPTGDTRDSSLIVADEAGNKIEFPRISSMAAASGLPADLAAKLDVPVYISQGRQGTGPGGKFTKGTQTDPDGQSASGFGLEHVDWKHGWEMDELASDGEWEEGKAIGAIQKIMKDATNIGVILNPDGSVYGVNVYSSKTTMTVVLRMSKADSPILHVVTAFPGSNVVREVGKIAKAKLGQKLDTEKFKAGMVRNAPDGSSVVVSGSDTSEQTNEPGADYGQAEQTGEQAQAEEKAQLDKLQAAQGNGPAGPALFNAIPPTPPPPTPTSPSPAPAPAPLNPPATANDMARRVGDVLRGRYFDGISTKAHQNASRTGSAAVRAVADIIHTRGGTENPSTDRDLPKAIMTARAKYQNKFNKIMAPLREQLGRMTSDQREQFYRDLVDQITGRTNIQPGVTGHVATGLIDLLKELHDYRTSAGEDLGKVMQYFPAVYNSALITANKTAFITDATRAYAIELAQDPNLTPQEIQAKAQAAAEALYRTHTRGMGDAEWASIFKGQQDSATENSSKERVFGRQAQGIMSKWQSPDLFHVISRYIGSAVKRAELVRRFGQEGEKWEAMANAMEADGVPVETINEMAELVKLAAGLGVTPLGTGERMFMDTVNLYTAAAALGKSALNNMYEPGSMGLRASTVGNPVRMVSAYAETWARFIRNLVQMLPVLGDHVGPTFWQEYGEHIGSIHNSLDDAWMSMHAMEHGMEDADPRMRWITNRVYQANLMESTENAKLQASHALGHAYILDHAGLLDGSHYIPRLLKFDTRSTAEEALLELGIPKSKQDAFAAWCATLKQTKSRAARMAMLTDGSEMARLYEEAQLRFSHQAAVRANRAHKPIFQDAVLGRLALQLMSYSYSYFSEVTDRMYRMAYRAITTKDMPAIQRINMMLPVMLAPLTVAAMGALFESKDYLFPTESSEKRKKDHWIYKLLNAASFAGMFGPKIEMAMKYVARDQPPGGVAGQTIVAGGRVAKKGVELALDDTKTDAEKEAALKKAAARAAIAPIKAGAVTLGSAIHPAVGAVAVAATNTTGWSNELQDVDTPKKGTPPKLEGLPKFRK